jgi:hypothetical protein
MEITMSEETLMEKYVRMHVKDGSYDDKHKLDLDTLLRICIGKTDDINVSLCSHKAIINRELGEKFCRVCQKDLSVVGEGRYNDYLVLRHPLCQQPICLDCAVNNPDEFHKAFKNGLEEYKAMDPVIRAHFLV